jgi:CMP-N,N'-diacetyllegionaminic acid synthase
MLTLRDLTIRPHEPIRVALERMTQNRLGILFVCDEDLHLVGVLSDGDVRRTLLDDTLLVAAVSKAMNMDPITASTVEDAGRLLRRFGLVIVPVIGSDGTMKEAVLELGSELKVIRPEESSDSTTISESNTGALAIIPARGGSKRVPGKNLAMVAGKSLLGWAVLAARKAKRVGHILVSTDDPAIAEAGRACGADVPWLRPDVLAQDHTPTLDVVMHAIQWATKSLTPPPEFAVLLEPTAPLRTSQQIDAAIELLCGSDADAVISVSEVPHVLNPEELVVVEEGTVRPYNPSRTMDTAKLRGQQKPVYVRNGLVYAMRAESVLARGSLYGSKTLALITDWEYFLDIDTARDIQLADFMLKLHHTGDVSAELK